VFYCIGMGAHMRENGSQIREMDEDMNFSVMERSTWAFLRVIKHRGKAFILGPIMRSMRENGSRELSRATECGRVKRVIHTGASGKMAKLMGRGCISGLMAIATKASGQNL